MAIFHDQSFAINVQGKYVLDSSFITIVDDTSTASPENVEEHDTQLITIVAATLSGTIVVVLILIMIVLLILKRRRWNNPQSRCPSNIYE